MLSRAKFGLFMIFFFALTVFLVPYMRAVFFSGASGKVTDVILIGSDNESVVENYFMLSWGPDVEFVRRHLLKRYVLEDVKDTVSGKSISVRENKAAFLVSMNGKDSYLYTEKGEVIWHLKKGEEVYFSDLPTIFGEKDYDLTDIIEIFSSTPLKFRNFISSIDADSKKIYFRNGNVLITRSWDYLKIMDWNSFIADLKIKTVYELYSNGKYFPISRER